MSYEYLKGGNNSCYEKMIDRGTLLKSSANVKKWRHCQYIGLATTR